MAFKPQLLADKAIHDLIFLIRKALEDLDNSAKARNEPFSMPPCHSSVKTLTKWIHQARQPAGAVASAIQGAASANADSLAAVSAPSKVSSCLVNSLTSS